MKKKNIKKTNNNKILIIAAAVILAIGIAYISFSGILESKISLATIRDLAKDKNLKIVTTTAEKILVSYISGEDNYTTDGGFKEEYKIYLELEDGKIYLTNGDHSSRITDIAEKVIFMMKGQDGCATGLGTYYLLTENKNLYVLKPEMLNTLSDDWVSATPISDSILNKILGNKSQKLNLQRINGNYKVLAFTNYDIFSIGGCTTNTTTVYTSDGKVRIIGDDLSTIHGRYTERIGYANLFGYEDNTLNIIGEGKVKNSAGEDLIYKKIFTFIPISGLDTHYVIIDENNYIYLETSKNYELSSEIENKVKLYSSTIKYVSYSNPGDKLIINLSNGKKLEFDTEDLEIK